MDPHLITASAKDIPVIAEMAARIWRVHYTPIIGTAQVDYMLEKMYSEKSLVQLMKEGQEFFLVELDQKPIGYISISQKGNDFFLHKFYMEIKEQGKGFGKKILAELLSKFPKLNTMRLQVNRMNYKTINFYFRVGFVIEDAKDFDIGGGFFMQDYVMVYTSHAK
jgi:GNAT superfamily N-acetyltransferase